MDTHIPTPPLESQELLNTPLDENQFAPAEAKMSRFRWAAIRIKQPIVRKLLAEFIGTAVILIIGDGSVAQAVLSKQAAGQFLSINLAWGLAVTFAVMLTMETSGAHLNPAITLTQLLLGNIGVLHSLVYMVAQYLGAFVGAAVVYITYAQALTAFDGGVRYTLGINATAGIFATYPQSYLTWYGGLTDQITGTAILCCLVLSVTDANNRVPGYLVPGYVGAIVVAIGLSYGFNCGYSINPARDLGPRVFTLIAGWGGQVFSYPAKGRASYSWFWVPVIGPYIGAILGAVIYKLLVGAHWPPTVIQQEMTELTPDNLDGTNNGKDSSIKYIHSPTAQTMMDYRPPGEDFPPIDMTERTRRTERR